MVKLEKHDNHILLLSKQSSEMNANDHKESYFFYWWKNHHVTFDCVEGSVRTWEAAEGRRFNFLPVASLRSASFDFLCVSYVRPDQTSCSQSTAGSRTNALCQWSQQILVDFHGAAKTAENADCTVMKSWSPMLMKRRKNIRSCSHLPHFSSAALDWWTVMSNKTVIYLAPPTKVVP